MPLEQYIENFIVEEFELNDEKSKNTKVSYLGKLQEFNQIINDLKGKNFNIASLCFEDLSYYIKILSTKKEKGGKGNSPSSIRNKFITVKIFLKYLRMHKVLKKDITKDDETGSSIKLPIVREKEPNYLSEDEYIEMLNKCKYDKNNQRNVFNGSFISTRNIALILTILSTGLRRFEVLGLKKDDIHNDSIRVVGKGNKEALIPLNPVAKQTLNEWIKMLEDRQTKKEMRDELGDFDNDLVFPSNRGGIISDGTYWQIIQKALSTINRGKYIVDENYEYVLDKNGEKIPNKMAINNHGLRRTFATSLLKLGVNLRVIQSLLRHSNITTTQKYLGVNESDKQEAVNLISMSNFYNNNQE